MRYVIALLAVFFASQAQAQPQTVIKFDIGGRVFDYDHRAMRWQREGRRIVIDGECRSACTRYLFTRYNLDVCMTPRAVFRFHKPFWRKGDGRYNVETGPARVAWANERWAADWLPNYPAQLARLVQDVPSASEIKDKFAYKTLSAKQMLGIIPYC